MELKFIILFALIFTLSLFVLEQDAFGIADCDNPRCHSLEQSTRSSPINGLEYQLDSPDLWVDRTACSNTSVAAGWLRDDVSGEWIEGGVIKGEFDNVGCVTLLQAYYAFNFVIEDTDVYSEYLVANGRVNPGDDITVKLQRNPDNEIQVQAYVTTPSVSSSFPDAQISLSPGNVYYADFGIEGTISATDEYSSIPMSKFTNTKIKQNNSWINLPKSATVYTPDTSEGYLGKKCPNNSFIAGSVTSLDCNNVSVRNQIPLVPPQVFEPQSNAPITINLDAIDTDKDYLTYNLLEHPTKGFLDHNNLAQKIPNTDGDSARLVYTPASVPPESDTIRYSVTDSRDFHTREGFILIKGLFTPDVPDAVDDFDFTLNDNLITFTWSHPNDGGSPITYYEVERSTDTINWQFHGSYSETRTTFDYLRHAGYDQYFRILTHSDIGASASSNLAHVHIVDPTPPLITIRTPTHDEIILSTFVPVNANVREPNNSGIKNIVIRVDNVHSDDPVMITPLSPSFVTVDSTLTDIPNGYHTIAVFADNEDGYTGIDSVDVLIDAPIPVTLDSLSEDFETDLYRWILTTGDDEYWSIRNNPIVDVPNSLTGNKVVGTEDCDSICSMIMVDNVDLTQMDQPTLSFYRYVGTSADVGEGIIVFISTDNGNSWIALDGFTADNGNDDGLWHLENYSLDDYSSNQFKLRFDAISTSNNEDTELDSVSIYDASVVPDITFTSSLNSDRSRITLSFDPGIDADFNTSDFTLSQGTISSVRNFDNSDVYLQVLDIPYDTEVTVTYVGSTFNLGSGVSGNLVPGTSSVTNSVSRPTPVDTPPTISSISDMSLDYTQTRTINVRASDSQNDSITLSLVNAPSFASIVDNGDGSGVITLSPSPSNVGSHNLLVKAVANSESDTEGFRVTVTAPPDTINPTITAPSDKTFEATSALTTLSNSQIGTPTATDNIDILLSITNNKPSSFPLGNTIITWTATDDSGNSSKSIQTITILDTTDPVFTLDVSDMSRMFASNADFVVTYDIPSAMDLVDSDVDVLCDPVSGSIFSFGENIITCTATDDSGNSSTTSFVVSVTVIIPAPSNLQTTSTHNSVTLDWDDSLDESITGYKILSRTSDQMELSTLISNTGSSDSMYVVEDLSPDTAYVFSVVALSEFGESSASNLVHIITMQQLPMITAPSDISIEATGILTDVDIGSAIIPDNSGLSVSNDAPTSFSLGTTIVTWTVIDGSGNTADATQNITVMDTTDPMFTLDVSDMSRMFASNADFIVNYDIPSATDLVDSDVDVLCDPVSGYIFSIGENIITCTATDDSGNFSTTSFVVSVSIGAPAAPSNIRVTTTHNSVTLDWDEPSDESITGYKILSRTSDQMELSVLIPDIGSPNSMYVVGALSPDTAYVFSVVALNEFGESPSSVFVYIITMQQPPMITAPPDISLEATGILTDVDIGSAIIPDNSELSVSNDAPTSFSLGTTVVTWTATNDSGNFVDATQNITVMDTTDPAFTLDISDMSRMFNSGADFIVNYDTPSATDLVDSDVDVLCDPVSGSIFSFGENIITCTATDDSGNFSTTSFVVFVRVIIPAPSNIQATSTHNSVTLDWDDSPDESITGYKILFGIPFISQQLHTFISDTGSSDSMYVVEDLSSDTDYIFSVVALNEFGESTASDLVYGATLQLTPMITAPPDISIEATGILTDVDIGSAIIPDNSGLSVSNDAPTSFSLGTTIVTWTATNNSGNSVDATQNITVMDTTDPAFDFFPQSWESVVPSDQIITVIFPTPTVRDIADNNPDVICTPASGTMFAVGSTTVTCTATDDSGNSSTTSFVVSVSVRIPVPQSPPSAPSTLQATSTHNSITLDWDEPPDESITGYKILSRTSDQMELSTLISDTASSDSMYVVDGLSPDTIYVFRVIALSEFDESSVSNFVRIATLQQAFIIPNLQAIPTHNSVTLDWDEPPDESITGYKIRSIISFIPQQLSTIVFDTGSPDSMYVVENLESERTYAFRVIALNELGEPTGFSDVRITTLQDPRTFTRITTPPDISIEATGILTDVDIGSASLPANSNYSLSNDAPISFPLGTTIVTWDAIDDIGSASVATQSITVRDTTAPTFDPFTQSWGFLFTSEQTRTVIFLTTASDIVDNNPDVICTPASGTVFAVGSTIVTCTATDDSGNSTVITFDVFVSQSTSMPS